MSDAGANYGKLLQQRQTQAVADYAAEPDISQGPDVEGQAMQSMGSAGEPQTKKPSLVKAGVAGVKAGAASAGESMQTGFMHTWNAVTSLANSSPGGPEPDAVLSSAGQIALGGLTMFMAIPGAIGPAIRGAVGVYAPGLEKTNMLPGEVAGGLRAWMGLPSLLGDPELRKAFVGDPSKTPEERMAVRKALMDEINKPMTYGEFLDLSAALVAPGLFLKGIKFRASKPGLLDPFFDRPTPEPLQVKAAVASETPKSPGPDLTPQDAASHLERVGNELHGAEPGKSEPGATSAPTEPAGAPPAVPAEPAGTLKSSKDIAMESTSHYLELRSSMDVALKRSEEVITESLSSEPKYAELVKDVVKPEVPATPPGETPPAEKPAEPLAKKSRGKRPKLTGSADVPKEPSGETGSVEIGLLSRMALGAAIGGTQGDTPEERVAYAMIGMFGLGFGGKLAKNIIGKFREDPKISALIDDPSNPKIPIRDVAEPLGQTTRVVTEAAGEYKGAIERLLNEDGSNPLTHEELKLAKRGEMNVWQHIKDVSDKIVAGEDVQPGDLTQAMSLARTLHDSMSGRRFGATGARGMEKVKVNYGEINKLAKEWSPETTDMQMATALQGLGSIEDVGLFTRLYYAVPEAITQAMYGTMLSGKAVVKNGLGNIPMVPIGILDRSLASLNVLRSERPGGLEGPMAFISVWESSLNQIRMLKDSGGIKSAWAALDEQAARMGMTHVEVTAKGFDALADISQELGAPNFAKGVEFLGNIFDLGPGAMRRTDGMAKVVNGDMMIQWEAMQKAASEGHTISTPEYWDRVRDIKNDYSQLDAEALVRVTKFRDRQTFTTPFENVLMRGIQAGPNDPWLQLAYRLTIAPFVRTPVRLMEVGTEYTPGLNMLSSTARNEWFAGGSSRAVVEARLASGAIMLGSFGYLAMQGLITGNLPAYPISKTMEHAGRPIQSVWDPLAQKYRSYAGLEPLTQVISTASDIAYLVGQLPERDGQHLIAAYTLAVGNNIGADRFMQVVGELADIAKQGRTDAQWDGFVKFARQHLGGFKPGFAKEALQPDERTRLLQTGKYDDEHKPMAPVWRELQTLIDDYKRGLGITQGEDPSKGPFIKRDRNMFTGVPLVNDTWPYNPFTTTQSQGDPWAQEIRRLNGAGIDRLPEWIGTQAPANIGMSATPTNPGVRLQTKELDRLEVLMTQVVKDQHGTLTESMDWLVQSPRYLQQSDVGKKEWLQGLWTEFRQRAEVALLKEFPQLKNDYEQKVGAHGIERISPSKQPAAREQLQNRIDRNQLRTTP